MTYRQKALRGLSCAFFDSDLVATRMTLAIAEFAWFVMLAWPGDTFGRQTYAGMASIAIEPVWAVMFGVSAAMQAAIVIFSLCGTKFANVFGAWNAALWIVTVVAMLLSVYPPPAAIGGEVALMAAAIWIGIRPAILMVMQRKYDSRKAKQGGHHAHA